MFRISHIIGVHRQHDRRCLEEIRELFESAFPDYADDPEYIPRKLNEQASRGIPAILLAAHGEGDRVIGFAAAWPTTSRRSTTPTSISSSPAPSGGAEARAARSSRRSART